jgi:integrase/recombinase XerC
MTDHSTAIVQTSPWTNTETRKRNAVRAAHTQDQTTLLTLLEYHLSRYSLKTSRLSSDTLSTYRWGLNHFLEWTGPAESPRVNLLRLEHDHLREWFFDLAGRGVSPRSVQTYVAGVRALFRALIWADAVKLDPFLGVHLPQDRTPKHARRRALSVPDYARLLELPRLHLPPGDPRVTRDRLLIGLGASCGLRGMELCALDLADIRLEQSELVVQHGKGDKYRTVPLSNAVQELIRDWLEVRRSLVIAGRLAATDSALLLSFVSGRVKRLGRCGARKVLNDHLKTLGLPPEYLGLHTLRRTAGTHLYKATRDLHVVADILGHENVKTAAIYAQLDQSVRLDALEAMEALRNQLNV